VSIVEHVELARDRGFLAELPYDQYAGRDIRAGCSARCERLGPERQATHSVWFHGSYQ
jgi:hypothetical protein